MSGPARLASISVLCLAVGCSTSSSDPEVRRFHELLRRSDGHPRPLAPREVLEVAESLFGPPAVEIPYRVIKTSADGPRIVNSGTIWYSDGRLFVEGDASSDPEERSESFATLGDELVSWMPGDERGVSFDRFDGDTATFLWYLVDFATIKSSIYIDSRDDPGRFRREPSPDGEWILFREPDLEGGGFLGLEVGHSPLWLRSVRYQFDEDGLVREFQMDRPRPLSELPARLSTPPQGVTFERVRYTIDSRMDYL